MVLFFTRVVGWFLCVKRADGGLNLKRMRDKNARREPERVRGERLTL